MPLAAPWPRPRILAYAALVLGVVALATYGPHALRLGFYLDDWVLFEDMLNGGDWWGRVHALAKTNFAPRTLEIFVFPTIFQFAGFRPAPYQAMLVFQDWVLACAYFVLLRRWLGSDRIALTAASLGLIYPICPATHHWITSMPQQGALVLTFASLLAHLVWLEHRKFGVLALALILYGLSLVYYEAGAFLPWMQAAALCLWLRARGKRWREVFRAAAQDVLLPYTAVLLAGILWQNYGGFWLTGALHPKTFDANAGWILKSYMEALNCLGPEAWQLITQPRPGWADIFTVRMSVVFALFVSCAAWADARVEPRTDEAPALPMAAVLAGIGLLGAYLPFALTGRYEPQVIGILSRINASGALIGGLILAAALEGLVVAGCRGGWPRSGRAARAIIYAALLAGFTWTNWYTARLWVDAWTLEQDILAKASSWVRRMPYAKSILLKNAPPHIRGSEVFSESWGFSAGLRLASGRKDIGGVVIKPCMRTEPRGFVNYCGNQPIIVPYEGLFIYDAATDKMLRPIPAL